MYIVVGDREKRLVFGFSLRETMIGEVLDCSREVLARFDIARSLHRWKRDGEKRGSVWSAM